MIILALQDTISSDLRSRARSALLLERNNGRSRTECENEKDTSACPPSKFRSPTGECNNVNHREWGSRGDVFMRMLAPDYADKKSKPRSSVGSHALPSADFIVQHMQKSANKDAHHPHITAMLPAWGQLLAYDLFQIVSPQTSYKCCDENAKNTEDLVQCYVKSGEDCKEYMRSVPSREFQNCKFTHREQMNAASGVIDGSGLYGATEKEFQALRTYTNGKVDIKACARCNEAGAIGALHVILLNEHNRVAEELHKLNNDWNDATLFLEARRVVTAEIQHITYNEFIPIALGQQVASKDELRLVSGKHYTGYSSTNRAGIFNEAAVSAFPAFYSMLPADMMNETKSAENLISTPALQQTFIPIHETFDDEWSPIALAIQRARDHGIPAYHKALNLCEARLGLGKGVALTYEDVEFAGVSNEKRNVLESTYQ